MSSARLISVVVSFLKIRAVRGERRWLPQSPRTCLKWVSLLFSAGMRAWLHLCSDANRGFDLAAPRISYQPRNYQPGTTSMHAASAGVAGGKREGLTECSDLNSGMLALGAECTSEGLAYRCMGESQAGGMPGLQRRGPHDCLPHSLATACRSPATALCLPHLTPAAGPSLVFYPVSFPLFCEGPGVLKFNEAGGGEGCADARRCDDAFYRHAASTREGVGTVGMLAARVGDRWRPSASEDALGEHASRGWSRPLT